MCIKINRKVAFLISYSRTKKSKYCCHPPFHPPPPIFCRHSSKLLSTTLPKLMNWILLAPPPLSSDLDNPPKFGTCTIEWHSKMWFQGREQYFGWFYQLPLWCCHAKLWKSWPSVRNTSFIKILNKIGQRIELCSTPRTINFRKLKELPFLTHCLRWFRCDTISLSASLVTPYALILAANK